MKRTSVILGCLLPLVLLAQVDTAWVRRYNGPGNQTDWAYNLALDASGNLYVSGGSYGGSGFADDWCTIKYLPNGDTAWVRRLANPGNYNERSNAMVIGPSGNIHLTGYTMYPGNGNFQTVKYAPNGDTLWARRYDGPDSRYDFCRCIGIDDSENVYVSGYSQNAVGLSNWDIATIKYSPDGVQRWVQRWEGGLNLGEEPNAMAVDRFGNSYVVGFSRNNRNTDIITLKYSPVGAKLWERRYNGPGDSSDVGNAVAVDSLGNVYVVGQTYSVASRNDVVTIKYGPGGETLWTRVFNSPDDSSELGRFVKLDPRGRIYVSGDCFRTDHYCDFLAICYNPAGDTLWVRYSDGPTNGYDQPDGGLALDAQGNVYLGGRGPTLGNGTSDYLCVKYAPDGTELWKFHIDGADSSDWSEGVVAGPDGSVYLTGYSRLQGYGDYMTVRLRQGPVPDVGVTHMLAPTGLLDSGVTVAPACSVGNPGSETVTYSVRLRIGADYNDTAQVSNHAPGRRVFVAFPNWTADSVGSFAVTCSTQLVGDLQTGNDRRTGAVSVVRHDVAPTVLLAPAGLVDSGVAITPACSVMNFGTVPGSYAVRLAIGNGYEQTASVTNHVAGTAVYVTFPVWNALTRGVHAVICSTQLGTDLNPANDQLTGQVTVAVHDLAARAILAPAGPMLPAPVTPRATVANLGTAREPCRVHFAIGADYRDSFDLGSGLPPADTELTFTPWNAQPGNHTARCSVSLAGDQLETNNLVTLAFRIDIPDTGWVRKADVPAGPRGKNVKDGGALAYQAQAQAPSADSESEEACAWRLSLGLVYAFKGNNTCEFLCYNVADNSWATKDSIPAYGSSGRKKAVRKGATLVATGTSLFATKGNGTLEFWNFTPSDRSGLSYAWTQKTDVPAGSKTIKEGAGATRLAVADTEYVYLLKGSGTAEFYRYHLGREAWERMADAPLGTSGKAWKNGSCLALDETGGTIYALKAGYNELHAYDAAANLWTSRTGLPLIGSLGRKKKVKDGAGIAYRDGRLFALKGGNTQEAWCYVADSNTWFQIPDLPIGGGRKVKGGGALVYVPEPYPALFALKGNNTLELWRYGLTYVDCRFAPQSGAQGNSAPAPRLALSATPNPCCAGGAIRYSLAADGPVSIELRDLAGRRVRTLVSGTLPRGEHTVSLRPGLPPGVYFLRLRTSTETLTRKLVLE